jgi:hypothetical protein
MADMWVLPLVSDATVPNHASEPSVVEILYLPSHCLLLHTYSTISKTKKNEFNYNVENMEHEWGREGMHIGYCHESPREREH